MARTDDNVQFLRHLADVLAGEIGPDNCDRLLGVAEELQYLGYFHAAADFGPADSDVRELYDRDFEERYARRVPYGYRRED